ncbi:type II toxin-antitoxin system RelE/ParE family toxin [Halomonas sp. SpR1]|uniref:type II toxin-antitoxin system RelE/ParE family toxin n=1 Tax=Halomonas sp. SpR1 TaxID=3050462 RepID=UPI0027E3D274|nr:type II toxin-antitoxin system RelE/ParE family toxin [Halomonas sp. SpR1]MDQ7733295.1 type II toxin-antitoxin system RelE/ParE family toxin [Halomonas sp. SpR1]
MSLPIYWYDEAIHDLLELVTYIAERDPQAARRLRSRIEAAVSLVAEHPYLHQVGRLPGTREIVAHPNFIVIYQVTNRIEVISVVHSRQNYP